MTPTTQIIIEENPTRLAGRAADFFVQTARNAVKEKGRFMAALSGGSTPRSTHRMLAEEPRVSEIPWARTHLFWVDERCVPENDEASNYGAARRDFLERIPLPDDLEGIDAGDVQQKSIPCFKSLSFLTHPSCLVIDSSHTRFRD